jgi:hypothetical protein
VEKTPTEAASTFTVSVELALCASVTTTEHVPG